MQPRFSVCVATLGRPQRLQPLLDSLAALRMAVPWEVLLVFNTPSAPRREDLPAAAATLPLQLLHEPRPGKSRALNRALDAATGEWLVYTDDDVTHDPDWLGRLDAGIKAHPWARVVGGRIEPRGAVPSWILRSANLQPLLLGRHDLGPVPRPYPVGQYPFGPNLAIPRAAVVSAGLRWPEHLGPGTRFPVGDESAFLSQLSALDAGDRCYVPDAVVYHRAEPAYFALGAALKRAFIAGMGAGGIVARAGGMRDPQRASRVTDRIRGLRSFRELLCVGARALGVAWGRLRGSPAA